MIVTDAGPLVALIDNTEEGHHECVEITRQIKGPLFTTWPAFTEAMYLLKRSGWHCQHALWEMVHHGFVEIADPALYGTDRVSTLMRKYNDIPMSIADASLVAMCETIENWRIFTLDSAFHIYRGLGRHRFELVPSAN